MRPVRLARGDQDVRGPALDAPVQVVALLDLEVLGVVRGAAVAVPQTVLAVDLRVDLGEELPDRRGAVCADGKPLGAVDKRFEHLPPPGLGGPVASSFFRVSSVFVCWCLSRGEDGFSCCFRGCEKSALGAAGGQRQRLKRGAGARWEIETGARGRDDEDDDEDLCVREADKVHAESIAGRAGCVGQPRLHNIQDPKALSSERLLRLPRTDQPVGSGPFVFPRGRPGSLAIQK